MSESMADYTSALDNSMRTINAGDIVHGTVVGISDTEVTIDLSYYAEGIIPNGEYSGDPSFSVKQDVNIGDEVVVKIIKIDERGRVNLTIKGVSDEERSKCLGE